MTMVSLLKALPGSVSTLFLRCFPKRNIIIISERRIKHLPISGPIQFCGLALMLGSFCWAAYSTGSYLAAQSALREQSQALRSVANARIETNFNTIYPGSSLAKTALPPINLAASGGPATLDSTKLIARIAMLEHTVAELKDTNEAIVQRVQDKTAGRISDLETIIQQTGLSASDLKKQLSESKPEKTKRASAELAPSQGGPYIPAEPMNLSVGEKKLFSSLDELAMLDQIVGNLPLARPIKEADEQSTFGHRVDPFTGRLAFHSGLDLSGPAGAKVYSTADGKVTSAGRNGAYGNAIDINHGFGITTRYGHLSSVLVQEGQLIKKGDLIGIQGSTGRSTGPHLHYEVRYRDQPMNPKRFLDVGRYIAQE